ncbi:MAG: hypothetical protein AB1345_07025 [Chloroflexota bacterium]
MKTRFLYPILALIAAVLACNAPSVSDEKQATLTAAAQATNQASGIGRTGIEITELSISPTSGSGKFRVHLAWDPHDRGTITCEYSNLLYSTQGGDLFSEMKVGVGDDPGFFDFDFEETRPGDYVLTCFASGETGPLTVTSEEILFTVIGPTDTPMNTPTETPVPTQTPTATQPPAVTLKGQIIFDFNKVQSDIPAAGGEMAEVTNPCIPEITIGADGTFDGACEKLHITAFLVDESFTAQVIGKVDTTGNVTFTYEVSAIGTPNGVWRISYTGQGTFTTGTQASGTANFWFFCDSGSDEKNQYLWCANTPNFTTTSEFGGTLPWSFVPAP